ncbi:MAG: aminotransferase class I/II-fold pyridoxal phosphate-dependent enzyme [Rhizobiaceae bacterium]
MIFLSTPHVSGRELQYVEEVFKDNQIMPLGKMTNRFEEAFAQHLGVNHAVALSSATAGMHLALRLVGVERGDRVYTASLTFIGGVGPITYQGAEPVFFDCDANSWCIDCDLLEEQLSVDNNNNNLPAAIVPTDLYGHSVDLDRLTKIANRYEIPLVIDSAEVLGGTYKYKPAGAGGVISVHSFNGNKMITASGGGMLVTNNEEYAKLALKLATQAREPELFYQHETIGYNYRISNVMSAIGLGQLETLDEKVQLRRAVFARYQKEFASLIGVEFSPEAGYGKSSRWLSVLTIDERLANTTRDKLITALGEAGAEARPVWKPMHMQPVFSDCDFYGSGLSQKYFETGLCLPSSPGLTDADQTTVIEAFLQEAS